MLGEVAELDEIIGLDIATQREFTVFGTPSLESTTSFKALRDAHRSSRVTSRDWRAGRTGNSRASNQRSLGARSATEVTRWIVRDAPMASDLVQINGGLRLCFVLLQPKRVFFVNLSDIKKTHRMRGNPARFRAVSRETTIACGTPHSTSIHCPTSDKFR